MHTHAPSWMVVSSEVAADISYQALIPAIIFTLLALAAVALRLYSRACLTRSVGLEDYLVTTAMVSNAPHQSAFLLSSLDPLNSYNGDRGQRQAISPT